MHSKGKDIIRMCSWNVKVLLAATQGNESLHNGINGITHFCIPSLLKQQTMFFLLVRFHETRNLLFVVCIEMKVNEQRINIE